MAKVGLTIIHPILNEEENFAALDSVWWTDEIVVAHSGGRHRTVEIVRAAGARVVPFVHSGQGPNAWRSA